MNNNDYSKKSKYTGAKTSGYKSSSDKPKTERKFTKLASDRPKFEKKSDKPFTDKPKYDKPATDKPRFEKKIDKPFSDKPKFERKYDKPAIDKLKFEKKFDKPFSDKPKFERKFDKPATDRPKFDKPATDRPKFDKPFSDKPKFERKFDKSNTNKPRYEKPKYEASKSPRQEFIKPVFKEEDFNNFFEDKDTEVRNDIVYGRNPVLELFKAEKEIDKLYIQRGAREGSILKLVAMARDKGVVIVEADIRTLDKLSDNGVHQGIAALVSGKEYCEIADILDYAKEKDEAPFIVICENINDPHNFGAIIRTADCAGVHGIIIPKRKSVSVTSAVFKTSAGAAQHMKIARVSNIASAIDELKSKNIWIYGTDNLGDTVYYKTDLSGAVAIVIGSEGEGLQRLTKDKCDYLLSIPVKGKVNSLNASNAAAIVMYEAAKQRNK